MGIQQKFFGHDFHQLVFDGSNRFSLSQTGAVGESENMRVDGNHRVFKHSIQDDVGCFTTDTWQCL